MTIIEVLGALQSLWETFCIDIDMPEKFPDTSLLREISVAVSLAFPVWAVASSL